MLGNALVHFVSCRALRQVERLTEKAARSLRDYFAGNPLRMQSRIATYTYSVAKNLTQ